jgi:hypothetical protein
MKNKPVKLKKEECQFIKAWCDLHKLKDCTVVRDSSDYVMFDKMSYFWFPNKFQGMKTNHKYKLNELINEEEMAKEVKMPKKTKKINKIDWEKVIKYGVALGWMASMLYLMLILTAYVTA